MTESMTGPTGHPEHPGPRRLHARQSGNGTGFSDIDQALHAAHA